MQVTAEAIQLLLDTGKRSAQSALMFKTPKEEHVLMPDGEVKVFEVPPPCLSPQFLNVESFVEFVDLHQEGKNTAVFVNEEGAEAIIGIGDHQFHRAKLPFSATQEFASLLKMRVTYFPKDFWRVLATEMPGAFPADLGMQIRSLRVIGSSDSRIDIAEAGFASGKADQECVTVSCGTEQKEVRTQWAWTGKIFDGLDSGYSINCRLVVDTCPLTLSMVALDWKKARDRAIEDISDALRKALPDVKVMAGKFDQLP